MIHFCSNKNPHMLCSIIGFQRFEGVRCTRINMLVINIPEGQLVV